MTISALAAVLLLSGDPAAAEAGGVVAANPQAIVQTPVPNAVQAAAQPIPAVSAQAAAPAPAPPSPAGAPASDGVQPDPAAPPAAPPSADGPDAITVTARPPSPADPLAEVNAKSFEVVQAVDDAVIAPVAHGYMNTAPRPLQKGVHNFLNNLDEPVVFLNFLLQLKIGKAVETLGRFTINSTVGVAGLFDVAKRKPFRLPRRSNGLADTLGFYGVKPGPYFFLPLIGPTTLRDMLGRVVDLSVLPATVGKPFTEPLVSLGKGALSSLDDRVEMDAELRDLRENTADPYVATRERYLKRRAAEIDVLRGKRRSVEDPRPPEPPRWRKDK